MPSCLAQLRPDGLLASRQVSHRSTYRRTMRASSLLRHGLGGCHRGLSKAFRKFRMLASYGSLRDSFRYSDAATPHSGVEESFLSLLGLLKEEFGRFDLENPRDFAPRFLLPAFHPWYICPRGFRIRDSQTRFPPVQQSLNSGC